MVKPLHRVQMGTGILRPQHRLRLAGPSKSGPLAGPAHALPTLARSAADQHGCLSFRVEAPREADAIAGPCSRALQASSPVSSPPRYGKGLAPGRNRELAEHRGSQPYPVDLYLAPVRSPAHAAWCPLQTKQQSVQAKAPPEPPPAPLTSDDVATQ